MNKSGKIWAFLIADIPIFMVDFLVVVFFIVVFVIVCVFVVIIIVVFLLFPTDCCDKDCIETHLVYNT